MIVCRDVLGCLRRGLWLLYQKALVAAVEGQGELETGASGTVSKVVRRPAMDGVDVAVEGDVDLAVEGGDDVGESALVGAGAQVDRAFEGLFEQRCLAPWRSRSPSPPGSFHPESCLPRTEPWCRGS